MLINILLMTLICIIISIVYKILFIFSNYCIGDVAYCDVEGNFYFIDRIKELIKYNAHGVCIIINLVYFYTNLLY